MKGPKTIETRRLLLRKPALSDAEAIFERYAADPVVTRYMSWPTHRTLPIRRISCVERRGLGALAGRIVPGLLARKQKSASRRNRPLFPNTGIRGDRLCVGPGRVGTGFCDRSAASNGRAGAHSGSEAARGRVPRRTSAVSACDGEVRISERRHSARAYRVSQSLAGRAIGRAQLCDRNERIKMKRRPARLRASPTGRRFAASRRREWLQSCRDSPACRDSR